MSHGMPVKSVVIAPDNEESFRKDFDDQIRRRAFELYCRRTAPGADKSDWIQAERETVLSPLAGIEDDGHGIRITAAVPDIDAGHLTIDVLHDSIIVEGVPLTEGSKRYSVFPLHERINPAAVKAELSHGYLTIMVPKAGTPEP